MRNQRFIRTLKEACLYVHQFHPLEEARFVIGRFVPGSNSEWLLERLGDQAAAEVRCELPRLAA